MGLISSSCRDTLASQRWKLSIPYRPSQATVDETPTAYPTTRTKDWFQPPLCEHYDECPTFCRAARTPNDKGPFRPAESPIPSKLECLLRLLNVTPSVARCLHQCEGHGFSEKTFLETPGLEPGASDSEASALPLSYIPCLSDRPCLTLLDRYGTEGEPVTTAAGSLYRLTTAVRGTVPLQ